MAEEKKEPWLNYLALTTVIFAVCATLSTLKGGGYSTKSVMSQSQASDQWAYYQAKSIKAYAYELQMEKFEMDLRSTRAGMSGSLAADYRKKIDTYGQKLKKYDEDKAEIKKKAEESEAQRDLMQKHSGAFGMAAMFLQIAILLSSIAALMKQKNFWYLGMASGAFGLVYFFNGFFLFMK
jgi:DNA repair ATPase RecN